MVFQCFKKNSNTAPHELMNETTMYEGKMIKADQSPRVSC